MEATKRESTLQAPEILEKVSITSHLRVIVMYHTESPYSSLYHPSAILSLRTVYIV